MKSLVVRVIASLGSIAAVVTLVGACGASSVAGTTCTDSSDCGAGLTCVANYNLGDAGCVASGQSFCAHVCTTDADCTGTSNEFGSSPVCGVGCSGNMACGGSI